MSSLDALLAIHANVYLAGRRDAVDRDFPRSHPEFRFYEGVSFEPGLGFLDWAESLGERGAARIWLHRTDLTPGESGPYARAAAAEGLKTGLLVTGAAPTELWVSRTERAESGSASARIWRLQFTCYEAQAVPADTDRAAAAKRLAKALAAIEAVAATITPSPSPYGAEHFAKTRRAVAKAAEILHGRADEALEPVRRSVPADALDLDTLRMVAAAGHASAVGTGTGRNAWTESGTLEYGDATVFDGYARSVFEAAQGATRAAVNGGPDRR